MAFSNTSKTEPAQNEQRVDNVAEGGDEAGCHTARVGWSILGWFLYLPVLCRYLMSGQVTLLPHHHDINIVTRSQVRKVWASLYTTQCLQLLPRHLLTTQFLVWQPLCGRILQGKHGRAKNFSRRNLGLAYCYLVKSDITGFSTTPMYCGQCRVKTLHLDNIYTTWQPST